MKINKQTMCTITLGPNDAISNVCVDGSITKDSLLGVIMHNNDNGEPVIEYVCSRLIIQGGVAKGVNIRDGGEVVVDSGLIDVVQVEYGGHLTVNGGDATGITESGGAVNGPFMKDKGSLSFEPCSSTFHMLKGDITLHTGTTFRRSDCWDANVVILGGVLENCSTHHSTVNVYQGGTCRDVHMVGYSSLVIYGGTVENVKVACNSHIFLSPMVDQNGKYINLLEHVKNVTVRNSAWIEIHYDEGEEIPSLDGLTIEDGTHVYIDRYDDDDVAHHSTFVYHQGKLISIDEYKKLTGSKDDTSSSSPDIYNGMFDAMDQYKGNEDE